jgi:hypothetical protein
MLMEKHQLFTKPEAPKESWWTSPRFQGGGPIPEPELERMKRSGRQTGGELRVVGTAYGNI